MYATLSFESISVPVVTIGDKKYCLPSMREGLILGVITHCLNKHPNEQMDLILSNQNLMMQKLELQAQRIYVRKSANHISMIIIYSVPLSEPTRKQY